MTGNDGKIRKIFLFLLSVLSRAENRLKSNVSWSIRLLPTALTSEGKRERAGIESFTPSKLKLGGGGGDLHALYIHPCSDKSS